ncbi:MAG: T9SS type A sorting domain-containing protein [Bacteroidia bacterium]
MRITNPQSNTHENGRSEIGLFPNPSSATITITFLEPIKAEQLIQIYDIHGKLVYEFKNQSIQNFDIDVSEYDAGLYFVKVSNDKKVSIEKFIRQ